MSIAYFNDVKKLDIEFFIRSTVPNLDMLSFFLTPECTFGYGLVFQRLRMQWAYLPSVLADLKFNITKSPTKIRKLAHCRRWHVLWKKCSHGLTS
eukprot:CFRG2733T1